LFLINNVCSDYDKIIIREDKIIIIVNKVFSLINTNHFHYRHYYNNEFISLIEEIGFQFIEMYGQDTYIMDEQGLINGILEPDKMEIKKDYNGQFSIFVLKK